MPDSEPTPSTASELLQAEFDGKDKDHFVTLDTNPGLIKAVLQPVIDQIEQELKQDNE